MPCSSIPSGHTHISWSFGDLLCSDNRHCPHPLLSPTVPLTDHSTCSSVVPRSPLSNAINQRVNFQTCICSNLLLLLLHGHVQSRSLTQAPSPRIPSMSQFHWLCLRLLFSNPILCRPLHHDHTRPSHHLVCLGPCQQLPCPHSASSNVTSPCSFYLKPSMASHCSHNKFPNLSSLISCPK